MTHFLKFIIQMEFDELIWIEQKRNYAFIYKKNENSLNNIKNSFKQVVRS